LGNLAQLCTMMGRFDGAGAMVTTPSLIEAEPRLRRVREHIEELRRAGQDEDAEALAFVRDLAERVLAGRRSTRARDLLTTGQAGLALGLSDQTVRNWVAAGRLPAVKRGVRTMIPREAVLEEIERSRVRPRQEADAPDREAASVAWRRELLNALPLELVERLDALHEKLEDGRELSGDEVVEIARLEREMADAAARHLRGIIRRGRADPA
jgi:excisionase family DNA binding protein